MLITFEGIDGSGKTTTSELLFHHLKPYIPNLQYYTKKSLNLYAPYARKKMSLLAEVLWPSDLGQESRDPFGKDFWILAMAAWFSAMHHNRLSGLLNEGFSLIIDSWYYRLIAKMAISGLDPKWMNALFKEILVPSFVILLDIKPELAWHRTVASRKNFKLFETGSWHIEKKDDFSRYCEWQGQVRSELLKMANERDWYIIEQSEGQTADSVAGIISNHVRACAKANLPTKGKGGSPIKGKIK